MAERLRAVLAEVSWPVLVGLGFAAGCWYTMLVYLVALVAVHA